MVLVEGCWEAIRSWGSKGVDLKDCLFYLFNSEFIEQLRVYLNSPYFSQMSYAVSDALGLWSDKKVHVENLK